MTNLLKRVKDEVKNEVKKVEEETVEKVIYTPATDIYEDKDNIYVIMNVPGVKESDVDLSLEDGVLRISATQTEFTADGYKQLVAAAPAGIFKRSFKIEQDIDADKISALAKDGVLQVILPKAEKTKPKRITVKAC